MQTLQGQQKIINQVFDKNNFQLKSINKSGNKQFLQYWIDNDKLNQLLPIQIILNTVFDRQSASICINGNTSDDSTIDLTNYSGDINLKDSDGNNVLLSNNEYIVIGNSNTDLTINAKNIVLNQCQLNTANGLVKLNSNGFIDNELLNLSFNPENLDQIGDISVYDESLVFFTVKVGNDSYKNISLQEIKQFCEPKFITIE